MEGKEKLMFPLTDPKSVRNNDFATNSAVAGSALLFDTGASKKLKEIEERCKNDLLDICNAMASERKITVSSLINMQAITAMAEKLPESEEEMMNIPHITKANYEKIGRKLLSVTQHYAAMRLCKQRDLRTPRNDFTHCSLFHFPAIMIDVDEKEAAAMTANDSTDWAGLARSSSVGTPNPGGVKRKRGWITHLPSQRKNAKKTTRRATPKKRGTGGRRRGASQSRTTTTATTRRTATATSNLMPVPGTSKSRW